MENSDFFTRKGQGPKTSLKALTVVIKPAANFVSLVEEGTSTNRYSRTECETQFVTEVKDHGIKKSSDESQPSSYPCFLLCIYQKAIPAGYATQ